MVHGVSDKFSLLTERKGSVSLQELSAIGIEGLKLQIYI